MCSLSARPGLKFSICLMPSPVGFFQQLRIRVFIFQRHSNAHFVIWNNAAAWSIFPQEISYQLFTRNCATTASSFSFNSCGENGFNK